MQKFFTTFLLFFILTQSFSQTQHKISGYLLAQYNKTIHDRTIGNNPWGMGVGLQAFLVNNSKIKPTIDITADAYLEDDKVLKINAAVLNLPMFAEWLMFLPVHHFTPQKQFIFHL